LAWLYGSWKTLNAVVSGQRSEEHRVSGTVTELR